MIRSFLIALAAFVLMEPITAATHRFVMHGPGKVLHRSHHRRNSTGFELNDLFPLAFSTIVMLGFAIGFNVRGFEVLVPAGIGITLYGIAYALVHDVYIHQRLPWFRGRSIPLLDRLAAAHRVHHDRNGAPYGMLVPVRSNPSSGSRRSQVPSQP